MAFKAHYKKLIYMFCYQAVLDQNNLLEGYKYQLLLLVFHTTQNKAEYLVDCSLIQPNL